MKSSSPLIGVRRIVLLTLLCSTGGLKAGEFVTPEVPTPGRSVPFCSSMLGCLLSGVSIPEYGVSAVPTQQPVASPAPAPPHVAKAESGPSRPLRSKPARTLTVIVDSTQAAYLRSLVHRLRIANVKVLTTPQSGAADFSVASSLDAQTSEKAARLFPEQMQIVAGPAIRSVYDLRSQVVSFGPKGSMGETAARKAFAALNIPVKETPLDLDNAIDGLSTGDLAAVVVVAPEEPAQLERLPTPGIHFVPWPDSQAAPAGSFFAMINPALYPKLMPKGELLRTIDIYAVLKATGRPRSSNDDTLLKALAQRSSVAASRQ